MFDHVSKLNYLDLAYNQIEIINAYTFTSLSDLRTLWIYTNQIKSIDAKAFTGLSYLDYIQLSYNQLTNIEPFSNLTSLTMLDLNGNAISCWRLK